MINGQENISEVFSIFHDGSIVAHRLNADDLELEVDIQYLAKRINPKFTKFFLIIHGVDKISFTAWPRDSKDTFVLTALSEIFGAEPEILSSEIKNGFIEVLLNEGTIYSEGILTFKADSASVLDQDRKEYALNELGQICKDYWDEWGKNIKS